MGDMTSYNDFELTKEQLLNLKTTPITLSKIKTRSKTRTHLQENFSFATNSFEIRLKRRRKLEKTCIDWSFIDEYLDWWEEPMIHSPNYKTDDELDKMYEEFQIQGGEDQAMNYFFSQ